MSTPISTYLSNEKYVPGLQTHVSIGICARNCEISIKDTIESLTSQDFPHELMEILFVDDGSEDKTLSIIQQSIPRIDIPARVFRTSWRGLGHARNIVAANATGKYVLWVDGDMILSKNFVGTLVRFMEEHLEFGIVKGRQSMDCGGNFLSTLETCSRAASRMVNYQSRAGRGKTLGTGGAIYRIEAIKQTGGFDENLRGYGEDWDIELRIRNKGWALCAIGVQFIDYERSGLTWSNLWRKYWLRGYFGHYFYHKNYGLLKHHRMFPGAAFIAGFIQSRKLFRLTKKKLVFLLPFENLFKTSAWYVGYFNSHFDSYEPHL